MYLSRWDEMFERFKSQYSFFADTIAEWWPSGRREITIRFKDQTRVVYDDITDTMRFIKKDRVEANEGDEEKWREQFAYNLSRRMLDCGLTQRDIASRVGVTNVMMNRYCKGTSTPSFFIIKKIASVLQCSITELTEFVDVE